MGVFLKNFDISNKVGGFDITASDSADLAEIAQGLTCIVSGNATVSCIDGSKITIYLEKGLIFPLDVIKVFSSGTTASGIVGFRLKV